MPESAEGALGVDWQPAETTHTQRTTQLRRAFNEATADDQAFLQKVLQAVPFGPDFFEMRFQVFQRVRAIACSDLFEAIEDRFKERFCEPMTLEAVRSHAMYPVITERLQEAAKILSMPIEKVEQWLDATAPLAQRAVADVLVDRSVPAKHRVDAAAMILDRKVPKAGRASGNPNTGVLIVDEKSMGLLTKALEIMQAREMKQIGPAKPDADAS